MALEQEYFKKQKYFWNRKKYNAYLLGHIKKQLGRLSFNCIIFVTFK